MSVATDRFWSTNLRSKLLINSSYRYDHGIKAFLPYTVEGRVSRDDERYLFHNSPPTTVLTYFQKEIIQSAYIFGENRLLPGGGGS